MAPIPELLLITAALPASEIESRARRALAHAPRGRIGVLLRAPHLPAHQRAELGRTLREITRAAGVSLLVSADIELAQALAADGVHVPERGPSVAHARATLGAAALVGASRHDAAGLASAASQGASYATLGPVFASPGKGAPLGIAAFAEQVQNASLPVLALGGVEPAHVGPLLRAGAAGIAAIRAVWEPVDPLAAATAFLRAIDAAQAPARALERTDTS